MGFTLLIPAVISFWFFSLLIVLRHMVGRFG
jgi:hypothetical protein